MNQNINIELENLLTSIDNSELIKEYKKYKERILNNQELLEKINKIKTLDKYSDEYKSLKLDIYSDTDYNNYIKCETELSYFILEFNKRMKELIRK